MRVSQSVATSNAKKKMTQVRNYPRMTKTRMRAMRTVMTMTTRMTDTERKRKNHGSSGNGGGVNFLSTETQSCSIVMAHIVNK